MIEPPPIQQGRFDESIRLCDQKPFIDWLPSPDQIREFAAIIRAERAAMSTPGVGSSLEE